DKIVFASEHAVVSVARGFRKRPDSYAVAQFMKCPACENYLSPVKAGSLLVDVCLGGCGGIWFDNFELQKLDEPDEPAGNLLVQVNVADQKEIAVDPPKKRPCPKCGDIIMMRHFFSSKRRVEVDECPN